VSCKVCCTRPVYMHVSKVLLWSRLADTLTSPAASASLWVSCKGTRVVSVTSSMNVSPTFSLAVSLISFLCGSLVSFWGGSPTWFLGGIFSLKSPLRSVTGCSVAEGIVYYSDELKSCKWSVTVSLLTKAATKKDDDGGA
jgi:hypothetical protein